MEQGRRNLNHDDCVKAVTLINEGLSMRVVADRLGVSVSTISRVVQRFRETQSYDRRRGQGRPRVTTAIQDRFIRVRALRERFVTSTNLQAQLSAVHDVEVSAKTVIRRLKESNLHIRIPATGPTLNAEHRRARLQFAREHLEWNIEDWGRVLFTDESRFCLYSSDRRQRVIRRPNERYAQCNIRQTTLFNGGSVMVWGGISLNARTELLPVHGGALNSERYIREILSEHVVPFAPYIGDNFLLMQDNARPHVAHIVNEYLEEVGVETLNWPARSPDINPIEHIWDVLGRQLRKTRPPPMTLGEVQEALIQLWNALDQEEIRRLFLSMRRRCEAVVRSRGGNTRY